VCFLCVLIDVEVVESQRCSWQRAVSFLGEATILSVSLECKQQRLYERGMLVSQSLLLHV
jgi:hypothetical protein